MNFPRPSCRIRVASALGGLLLLAAGAASAATIRYYTIPSPGGGYTYGYQPAVALPTGNVVIPVPSWDSGKGAAFLLNGTTGALISSLYGSTPFDSVGSGGAVVLSNGNYVILSPGWDNAIGNVGAVTWGSGTTGVSGTVSASNSLIGSTASDNVGLNGVIALSNGHYVVSSPYWDNGSIVNAGAATWGNGATGITGPVSAANSLVGSSAGDYVGLTGVTALSNGNYVVASRDWDNGATVNAGAATWGNGTTGIAGPISAANSLVGTTAADNLAYGGVTALANGNYVVSSPLWDNGATGDAGAATWCNGTTGATGTLSAANSLIGSSPGDAVGNAGVTALTNGHYVVRSSLWDNGATADAGAATWGNGTTGIVGTISAANSLFGSTAGDRVGSGGATALSNGTYVVASPLWDNGATADVGAATWGNGAAGTSGVVSTGNSLIGFSTGDQVGSAGATALTNGHYVVRSPLWDNGATADAGAATWGNGVTGTTGVVSSGNSLVGSSTGDQVASSGVAALSNGNYVVASALWDNGATADVGAATWGNGATGTSGLVSLANSLVGSTSGDRVGSVGATALSNGNYVVASPLWDNGPIVDTGAATWVSGITTGVVSAGNSLVGSRTGDQVGSSGVVALSNGNYLVRSPNLDYSYVGADDGAVTVGSGALGVSGTIEAANSLIVGSGAKTGSGPVLLNDANSTIIVAGRIAPQAPFLIVAAADIPADQGGWLRLTFNRAMTDAVDSALMNYAIWRKVPGSAPARAAGRPLSRRTAADLDGLRATASSVGTLEEDGQFLVEGGSALGASSSFPPGTWALIASIPALQQNLYLADIPTISNAAPNDFVVTVHYSSSTSTWFVTPPVSGQSADNLAPAQPSSLTAAFAGGQTDLQWAPNAENDLASYRVYRGASADFVPSPGNQIAAPASAHYSDAGPAGSYYKVSAVDVNGNESAFALITPAGTTGAGGVPVAFALEGVWPNPARGNGLQAAFALPSAAPARLEVLDVTGRCVVTSEVGSLGVGRHTVKLAARRALGPGIYWIRLTQGSHRQKTKVTLLE